MSDAEDWSKFTPEALALVARLEVEYDQRVREHDRRVTELLEANNREVERRRKAEGALRKLIGYNENIRDGKINYRSEDHIQIASSGLNDG